MKQCTGCRRHVRPCEGACPFCGEVLAASEAPRLGAVVLLGALGVACTSRPIEDSATDGSSGVMTTGASANASTGAAPTTGGTTTSGPGSTSVAATSSGELTSSSDPDFGDSGCAFYGCPIDASGSIKECDQWMQDCPPGQKCMPWSSDGDSDWESLKCVPIARDPGQPGEPCTVEGSNVSGVDSCDVGAMCWHVDPQTNTGTCAAQCTGFPDNAMCADPGTTCLIAFDGVLSLCVPTCDPLKQDCASGDVCVVSPLDESKFLCVFQAAGGPRLEFDACDFANSCDAGLMCGNPELATECDPNQNGCCLAFCDVSMPTCNGQGAQCQPWFEMGQAPMGLENVGVCGLP